MNNFIRLSTLLVVSLLLGGCPLDFGYRECGNGFSCPSTKQCAAKQKACITDKCGNGVIDPGEACDDGNIIDGDGCSADCKSTELCGNGYIDTKLGEVCDDGLNQGHGPCAADRFLKVSSKTT